MSMILIKSDAYVRGLRDVILGGLVHEGLVVVKRKIILLDEEIIRKYQPILDEPSEFGEGWKHEVFRALSSRPVEVLLVSGEEALHKTYLLKKYLRQVYCPGSDYQSRVIFNLLHTPDDCRELDLNVRVLLPEVLTFI